jgi:uncharacterized RDD family membrane protein YckC
MNGSAVPGWYHADGDPPGTIRYWNGTEWVGPPQQAGPQPIVVHGRAIASPGKRVVAAIIDGLILSMFLVPVVLASLREVDWEAVAAGSTTIPEFQPDPMWSLAAAVFAVVYTVGTVAVWGATPGKRAMKIEIIRQSDGATPPGFMIAFVRYLPTLAVAVVSQAVYLGSPTVASAIANLSTLVQFASLILVFTDRTRRSIYDMAARTNVVDRIS